MKKSSLALRAYISLISIAFSTGIVVPAQARAVDPIAPTTASSGTLDAGGAADYWTEKRMRAATPAEPSASDGNTSTQTTTTTTSASTGIPYTSSEVTDPTTYPYTTHGRVFFRANGMSWTCSATVVTSENRSVVFTAGHCVHQGASRGSWATKWVFVPGYHDGSAPYGKWTAEKLFAPSAWTKSAAAAYDIGAAVLRPNAAGQRIADVVGSQGIIWNISRQQDITAYGYPSSGVFNGEELWTCESSFGWADPIRGPNPFAIGCNMTYGSSGGGWIVEINGSTYLNSVTSYTHPGEGKVVYGPYFGDAAAALYKRASTIAV